MKDEDKLKNLIKGYNGMQKAVAESILFNVDGYNSLKDFFNDFWKSGCSSGIIYGMIYYKETYKFFDKFSDEIFDLLDEIGEEFSNYKSSDRKNTLAWLAYEETARKIATDLKIEC